MPIKMPKTLDVPNIEKIENVEDIKQFLREFTEILMMGYEHSVADVKIIETGGIVYIGDSETDGSWRIKPVGTSLEIQRRVSGTWTKAFSIAGA